MASFTGSTGCYSWQVGLETDIGGGRENQDDCFVWIKRDDNIIVLCVLDGHGREVGKIASESAKACLFKHLDENYHNLIESPEDFLVNAHNIAHEHIRDSFRTELKRQGFDVLQTEDGFLMKRKQATDGWTCVHGGTSCSLIALIKEDLYIANVGDSTGILCSSHGILSSDDIEYLQDAAVPREKWRVNVSAASAAAARASSSQCGAETTAVDAAAVSQAEGASQKYRKGAEAGSKEQETERQAQGQEASNTTKEEQHPTDTTTTTTTTTSNAKKGEAGGVTRSSTLVITAEHSPECPYEYERLLAFRAREGSPAVPALVVVYDSTSNDKTRCVPCFERDADGKAVVTNKGSYYKNVRKEWASLVSTPPYAQFQDALAFTRSLGDLHLHTYGVTHLPEVQKIDIRAAFQRLRDTRQQQQQVVTATGTATGTATDAGTAVGLSADEVADSTLCLVLATDGVWDNWLYEDVNKFVMDASCLGAVGAAADGAKRVTISFMQRNALYAKRNFGSNADNATGVVLYMSQDPRLPSL